jgi:hypothetical protein
MWLAGYALVGGELQSFRILHTLQDLKRRSLESAALVFVAVSARHKHQNSYKGIDGLQVLACRFHHNPRHLKRNLSTSLIFTFT